MQRLKGHSIWGVVLVTCLVPLSAFPAGEEPVFPPTPDGTFEVTISGTKTGVVSGKAMFYFLDFFGQGEFTRVVLYDYASDEDLFYVTLQPATVGPPAAGVYPLSAFGSEGFLFGTMSWRGDDMWMISPEAEGTVELTHASDERLAGSFTLSGTLGVGEGTITLQGTFDAPKGNVEDLPGMIGQ